MKLDNLSIQVTDELALHKLAFLNMYQDLEIMLQSYFSPNAPYPNIDKLDPRGCTALHIAVMKGHLECVRILIKAGASCVIKNSEGWTLTNEATSLGNREILELVLIKKTEQMKTLMENNSPTKHFKNKDNKSFYLEINWGVQTWIPLVGSFCPSDQYKIYKKDDMFRVDTTLAGFENMKWKRGNITYLFSISKEKGQFLAIIDHDKKIYQMVDVNEDKSNPGKTSDKKEDATPDPEMIYNQINSLLNSPFTYTNVRTSHIKFERETTGFWPFGTSPKIEKIGEYNCEVWKMDNINIRSRTRSEHLKVNPNQKITEEKESDPAVPSDQSQVTLVNQSTPPKEEDFEKLGEQIQTELEELQKYCPSLPPPSPSSVTLEQYFDPASNAHIHLGRPITKKEWKHSMKATLWMAKTKESFENSEDPNLPTGSAEEPTFPLNINHIMPFLEVASLSSNQLVDKLKDFLRFSLPPGFPVQLQIPIVPMVSVKVGFTGYKKWTDEFDRELGDKWFEIPKGYDEGLVFDNLKNGLGGEKDIENY